MPRERKKGSQPPTESTAKKEGGSIVCALCGRSIKAGSSASNEPAIYSICESCKKMPHRNPGSIESLC